MKLYELAQSHLSTVDRTLAKLIKRVGPCEMAIRRKRSIYQALVQSIVYQQLNGAAAKTILGRVIELYPNSPFPSPEEILATDPRRLRRAGLSRAKTLAIKDIARKSLQGLIPEKKVARQMSNEQLIEQLTQIRGVGPWTVEMLLMFTLGRPDVLPSTDYGVRKGFSIAYNLTDLPHPKELLKHAEAWRPYRSIASWYLWRAVDL